MLQTTRFTKFEIDFIREYGNLTEREETILHERNKDNPLTIEALAEELGISARQTSRAVESLKGKIDRVLDIYMEQRGR